MRGRTPPRARGRRGDTQHGKLVDRSAFPRDTSLSSGRSRFGVGVLAVAVADCHPDGVASRCDLTNRRSSRVSDGNGANAAWLRADVRIGWIESAAGRKQTVGQVDGLRIAWSL